MGLTIQSSDREFNRSPEAGLPARQVLFSRLADVLGPGGSLLLPDGTRVSATDLRLFALGKTNANPAVIALNRYDTEDLLCFADDVYKAAPKKALVTRHLTLPSVLETVGAYGKDAAKIELTEAPLPPALPKQKVSLGLPKPNGNTVGVRADRVVDCGKADPYDRSTKDNGFVRLALVQLCTKLGPAGGLELHDGTRISMRELQQIAMGAEAPAILGSDLRPFAWFCDDLVTKVKGLEGKIVSLPKVLSDEFKSSGSEYDTSKNLVDGGWQVTLKSPGPKAKAPQSAAIPTTKEDAIAHPALYESFADELKAMPEVASAALAHDGSLIRFAPPAIRNDVAMVILACKTYVWGASHSDDVIRKSPEAAAKIIAASPAYARNFDACVYRDDAVTEARFQRAFKGNSVAQDAKYAALRRPVGAYLMGVPLSDAMFDGLREDPAFCALLLAEDAGERSLDTPGMERVECWKQRAALDPSFASKQVIKEIAALPADAQEALSKRVEKLHIRFPERFASLAILEQVLHDAEHPNDGRPVALIIDARADYNGALSGEHMFDDLIPAYRIVYKEAGCVDDVKRAYLDQASEPATLVREQAHGSQLGMLWGNGKGGTLTWAETLALVGQGLERGVIKGAKIYLGSCSTGVGKGNEANMANAHALMLPWASIFAPWDDSHGHDLDKDKNPIWNLVQVSGVAPYEVGPMRK
jgi:hypothetical protein